MSKIAIAAEESTIAAHLNRVVEEYPGVAFGSYPYFNHPDGGVDGFLTIVTIESVSEGTAQSAVEAVLKGVDDDLVLTVEHGNNNSGGGGSGGSGGDGDGDKE